MNGHVRRVQELRRSNAAQPRPGKRKYDIPWQEDIERCDLCGEECAICARGEATLERLDECTCLCQ